MLMIILRSVLALCLFLTFYALFKYVKDRQILSRALEEMSEQVSEHSRERQKAYRRLSEEEKDRGILKLERYLYSSGLKRQYPLLSAEIYLLLMAAVAGAGFLLMTLLGGGLMMRLAALCCGPLVLWLVLYVKSFRNYKRIENNLLVFLNLLGGFSITDSELTSIFYKVSRFVEPPLRNLLEDCYFETQTTGDAAGALENLMERVEHPMFKEIIRNLEVCSRYDADYASVVNSSRKSVQGYLSYRKKRKSIISMGKTEMLLLVIMVMGILFLINMLLETNIWGILFHTVFGKVILVYLGIVLAAYYLQIVLFDKD